MKDRLLKEVIKEIERELATITASALEAKAEATHEEAKAENKYDTRGLEASYLAGAQAKRAAEIQRTHAALKKLQMKDFTNETPIDTTALVEVSVEDEEAIKWFFILPQVGGMNLIIDGQEVFVISRSSPMAQKLVGKTAGDSFDHQKRGATLEYVIESIQ